jgi:hypothetical protein
VLFILLGICLGILSAGPIHHAVFFIIPVLVSLSYTHESMESAVIAA